MHPIRYELLFPFLFLVWLAVACGPEEKELPQSEPIEDLPAVFTGMISWENGPASSYHLLLEEDGYEELIWDSGRDSQPSKQSGMWILHSDTLFLFDKKNEQLRAFLYEDTRLTLVDLKGLNGAEPADGFIMEKSPEETSIRRHHNALREQGIDFVASGNEPFWNIQVDFDNELSFRIPETESFAPAPQRPMKTDSINWTSETEEGFMEITITENYCQDSMSGFLFTHTVILRLDGDRELHGCGRFL